jgi:hypothetical protein
MKFIGGEAKITVIKGGQYLKFNLQRSVCNIMSKFLKHILEIS